MGTIPVNNFRAAVRLTTIPCRPMAQLGTRRSCASRRSSRDVLVVSKSEPRYKTSSPLDAQRCRDIETRLRNSAGEYSYAFAASSTSDAISDQGTSEPLYTLAELRVAGKFSFTECKWRTIQPRLTQNTLSCHDFHRLNTFFPSDDS